MRGGIEVLASIHLHCDPSPRMVVFWKATDTTNPSMMPNAVHICHIIVKAPRMSGKLSVGGESALMQIELTFGCRLGCVDRCCGRLRTYGKTQCESSDEEIDPADISLEVGSSPIIT
jgi:hypothetical protein